jgi:hypothetical protein
MTKPMGPMSLDALRDLLNKEKLLVTFIKKDGTRRVMRCTTRPQALEKHQAFPKGDGSVNHDPYIVRVFDLDNKGWRSFDFDRLVSVSIA